MTYPCPDCRIPLAAAELEGPPEAPLCPHCGAPAAPPAGAGPRPRAVDWAATTLMMGPILTGGAAGLVERMSNRSQTVFHWDALVPALIAWFLVAAAVSGGMRHNSHLCWGLARFYAEAGAVLSGVWCVLAVPGLCLCFVGVAMLVVGVPAFVYFRLLRRLLRRGDVRAWRGLPPLGPPAPRPKMRSMRFYW